MIRVDDNFMMEVGLGDMPEAEAQAFIDHAEEELEVRVGQKLSENLSDAELIEFTQIEDAMEARNWLENKIPGFQEVVLKVFRDFKDEIRAQRSQILA